MKKIIITAKYSGTSSALRSQLNKYEIYKNGLMHKTYRGMASAEAQIDWRGHTASLEGVSTMIGCKGGVAEVIDDLTRGIRSGLSYSGAKSISEFHTKSEFIEVSHSSIAESNTHIFSK